MAVDTRQKNANWQVLQDNGAPYPPASYAMPQIAVLMDIRDELRRLNELLHCSNFVGIPTTLRSIRRAIPVRKQAKKP